MEMTWATRGGRDPLRSRAAQVVAVLMRGSIYVQRASSRSRISPRRTSSLEGAGGADHDSDGHVEYVALDRELLELFQHATLPA